MARQSKMHDDVETFRGKILTLIIARPQLPERSAQDIKYAANRFATIVRLLRQHLPPGTKTRRDDQRHDRVTYFDEFLAKQEGTGEPKSGSKVARKRRGAEDAGKDGESAKKKGKRTKTTEDGSPGQPESSSRDDRKDPSPPPSSLDPAFQGQLNFMMKRV